MLELATKDNLLTEDFLAATQSANITIADLANKCEDSVKQREAIAREAKVRVRWPFRGQVGPFCELLSAENECARAIRLESNKMAIWLTDKDIADSAHRDFTATLDRPSSYWDTGFDVRYAKERYDSSRAEADAAFEELGEAQADTLLAAKVWLELETKARNRLPAFRRSKDILPAIRALVAERQR